jgi:endonuclease-3 related protein
MTSVAGHAKSAGVSEKSGARDFLDAQLLQKIYRRLYTAFGPQHWWPGDSPLEIIIGAILTQNTAWGNVERAIGNLKKARLLSAKGLRGVHRRRLARCIRSAGYFNQKAIKLKAFLKFLDGEYGGSLKKMIQEPAHILRRKLLGVHGIGPETADSILLYACERPVFVVDAYTARILVRHGFIGADWSYEKIQNHLTAVLPRRASLYNEYHALLVRLGKDYCRKNPRCGDCPLHGYPRADLNRENGH